MVTWKNFTLDSVQTTIFTPENSAFSAGKVLAVILAKYKDLFDGQMQVLPIPSMIADLPHVVLTSSDGNRQLSVSPSRMDSIWKNSTSDLGDVVRKCAEIQAEYVCKTQTSVGRIAVVVERICLLENPSEILVKRFCNGESQKEPFNRSKSFEIHNHKEYVPKREDVEYAINSWVRCKADSNEGMPSAIRVQQDLNTLATETKRFEATGIDTFMSMAIIEIDEILRKYFPEKD